MDTSRLPPYSLEAEQAVLGCVLLEPKECLPECLQVFGSGNPFYDLRHQTLYRHLLAMQEAGAPIDAVTLPERLIAAGQLEAAGGRPYLAQLPDQVPSAVSLSYYTPIVLAKWQLRQMLRVLAEGVTAIHATGEREVAGLLDGIEAAVLAANENGAATATHNLRELVLHNLELLDHYQRGRGLIDGVRTGFGYLDKMTGGLHRKEMIVLAARPRLGKTSLAMNIAEYVAVEQQLPVGVFSLEMNAQDLVFRMLCARAGANFHQIRTGFMSLADHGKVVAVAPAISAAPIFIDDTPALDVLQMRARARRMKQRHDIRLLIIDYLQLAHAARGQFNGRTEEVTIVSNAVKAIAKELDLPVLALAQLSRELDKESHRKPRLADLRESGAIEQDADLVAMLYRKSDKQTERDDPEDRCPIIPVNLYIAKQRNGPEGDVEMMFHRAEMRFADKYLNRGQMPPDQLDAI